MPVSAGAEDRRKHNSLKKTIFPGEEQTMRFMRKGDDFFELFENVGRNLLQASTALVDFFESFDDMPAKIKSISDLEHDNDLLTHEIIRKLNKTFLTPIDREDIHALASRMDDVLDLMWGAAQRAHLFKIGAPTPESAGLAKNLAAAVELVYKAVAYLKAKKYNYIHDICVEIHGLQTHHDRIFRETLGKMFDEIKDPITIIKWKEVYEILENASDRCEDVANILESIVLKYG
jgi:predicted phosphate transport protein (TIGR00153 family)